MKNALVLICMGIALAGCEKPPVITDEMIRGQVMGSPDFRLPGPVYALKGVQDQTAQSGTAWSFVPSSWKPRGWSLWVASNVYSAYVAPYNDERIKYFGHAAPAWERSAQESAFIGHVHQWIKANNVPVEVNFMGYDAAPISGEWEDKAKGYYLTYNNAPCGKAFQACVDHYFTSPVKRMPDGDRLTFKNWISPFLLYEKNDHAIGVDFVIEQLGGKENEAGPFYDWWPTMVFLVNPEGKVTRAWLPQRQDNVQAMQVEWAIAKDMGGKYADLKFTDEKVTPGVPTFAYYGKDFVRAGLEKLLPN